MTKIIICAALLVIIGFFGAAPSNAQQTYEFSQASCEQDGVDCASVIDLSGGTIYGYSATDIDYSCSDNYSAYVEGYLKNQYGTTLDSGYDVHPYAAEVFTSAPANPGSYYTVESYHDLIARYYNDNVEKSPDGCMPCDGCNTDCYYYQEDYSWWDPYGFSTSGHTGNYGSWVSFFGNGPYVEVENDEYFDLGQTSDSLLVPALTVTMSSAQSIKDGETASFSVTTSGGTPTGYQWSFTAPSGSGNSPNVTFTPNNASSTTTDGHWFANPDSPCGAGDNAVYTIKCTVTFSNGHKSGQTTLTVSAIFRPDRKAAETFPPSIQGHVNLLYTPATGVFSVLDSGTLTRPAATTSYYLPTTSQFYTKIDTHEGVHRDQWATGMLSDLFTVTSLFNQLSGLTDSTQDGLNQQIAVAFANWKQSQATIAANRKSAAEAAAYQVSDSVAPQYKYQGACQQ